MSKKLKKILATVSAVAMCAVSVISTNAGAVAIYMDKTGKTYEKYTELGYSDLIRTAIDDNSYEYYYKEENANIISPVCFCFDIYSDVEVQKADMLSEFLAEKYPEITLECVKEYNKHDENGNELPIKVTTQKLDYHEDLSFEEKLQIAENIYENTGLSHTMLVYALAVEVTEIENTLPDPTLAGDANEDGEVSIADATLIMQSLVNPDEYGLTPQGIANADMNGDGITALDALTIQEMLVSEQ